MKSTTETTAEPEVSLKLKDRLYFERLALRSQDVVAGCSGTNTTRSIAGTGQRLNEISCTSNYATILLQLTDDIIVAFESVWSRQGRYATTDLASNHCFKHIAKIATWMIIGNYLITALFLFDHLNS